MSTTTSIALMAATALPQMAEGDDAPEWVHILPASGALETMDGRGPYYLRDPQAVIAASMSEGEIPVDQDHAMGKAASRGDPAPARGWITAMEARVDGIWAKVRWTTEGAALVASQAYRKLSPVIRYLKTGEIIAVREVSLVNRPNLRGLTALNAEGSDMLHEKLVEMLGLSAEASEDEVLAALAKSMKKSDDDGTAMQAAMDRVAEVVGLEPGASLDAVVTATKAARTASEAGREELVAMQSRLDTLEEGGKRAASTAFVDQAIRDGHAVPAADRDEYISMHMETPERAEKIILGLPKLSASHTGNPAPRSPSGQAGLDAVEAQAVALMGLDPDEYAKHRDGLGQKEEAL